MAQMVEHLPRKHEALSSNTSHTHTHTHTHKLWFKTTIKMYNLRIFMGQALSEDW
jgi:hypothetical protein